MANSDNGKHGPDENHDDLRKDLLAEEKSDGAEPNTSEDRSYLIKRLTEKERKKEALEKAAKIGPVTVGCIFIIVIIVLVLFFYFFVSILKPSKKITSEVMERNTSKVVRIGCDSLCSGWFWKNASEADVILELVRGADLNATDGKGHTPLHWAAWYNKQASILELFLDRGANINALDERGWTPLHFAVVHSTRPIVELFLDRGADTEMRKTGRTPLHSAAVFGNPWLVNLLLDRGADPTALDSYGQTPFELARKYNKTRLKNTDAYQRLLLATPNTKSAGSYGLCDIDFWRIAGETDVLTKLSGETDIEVREVCDKMLLHYAAGYSSSPSVVALLLDQGMDLEAQDTDDETPLHWAVKNGDESVIELLLDRNANIEAQDKDLVTPLHSAAFIGTPSIVTLLLDRGANLEARDGYGWTPLHYAAAYNQEPSVVVVLLDRGADPKALDGDGNTPFNRAGYNDALKNTDVYWRLNEAQYE